MAAALGSQAAKSQLLIAVDAGGVGRYLPEIEAAVYFCVRDTIQNVAKYAQANQATIHLRTENRSLVFSVHDDGRGFDRGATTPGAGITNMADRLAAVGGELAVRSRPGEGTTVIGHIPIAPPSAGSASLLG